MKKSIVVLGLSIGCVASYAQCDKVDDALKSLNLAKYKDALNVLASVKGQVTAPGATIENKCLATFYFANGSANLQMARETKDSLAKKVAYMNESEKNLIEFFTLAGVPKDLEARAKTDLEALANEQKNTAVDYFNKKEFETALKLTEQCINNKSRIDVDKKDLQAYYNASVLARKLGDFEKTVKYADIIIDGQYQEVVQHYGTKADALHQMGKTDSALATISVAQQQFPDDPNLMIIQLQIYREKGDNAKSIEVLEKLTTKVTDRDDLFTVMGELYTRSKEMDKAKDAYSKALGINDKNPDALYGLGSFYVHKGNEFVNNLRNVGDSESDKAAKAEAEQQVISNYSKAISYYEQVLAITPNDRATMDTMKKIYQSLQQYDSTNVTYQQKIDELNKKLTQ